MENQEKPKWMSDPLVAAIDPAKLEFLQTMVFETRGKSQSEMLPFLMNVAKQGKLKNISFNDQEMASIMAAIRSYSTPEELAQINKFMEMKKKSQR